MRSVDATIFQTFAMRSNMRVWRGEGYSMFSGSNRLGEDSKPARVGYAVSLRRNSALLFGNRDKTRRRV
jgi:hypothetical protein